MRSYDKNYKNYGNCKQRKNVILYKNYDNTTNEISTKLFRISSLLPYQHQYSCDVKCIPLK